MENTIRTAPAASNRPAFRCGTLADAGTPYDLGFVPGDHVHIQDRQGGPGPGYSIVHNESQLRWVTPYQVSAYIVTSPPAAPGFQSKGGVFIPPLPSCPGNRAERGVGGRGGGCEADPARQYLELRAALLASPAGTLEEPIAVRPRLLPAQVPGRYKGCPVVMADTSPVTEIPGWMGEHLVAGSGGLTDGGLTIYLETEYVQAILAQHRYDILWATFRHERFESQCELALARAEFPTARPRQLGGLAICMNGLAHKMTVRLLGEAAGATGAAGEREYNDMLDRQRAELGLGRV